MRYNRYLYRLPVQAVPITDIVKNSISSADIVTDPIIGTSLIVITVSMFVQFERVQAVLKGVTPDEARLYQAMPDQIPHGRQ